MPITINGSGTVTGISVGGLPDGIVDADMIATGAVTGVKQAAGSVIQVTSSGNITTPDYANTSSTYNTTGCTHSITPAFSSSKILVLITLDWGFVASDDNQCYPKIALYRDSTEITAGEYQMRVDTGSSNCQWHGQGNFMYLDSPNTTSATAYTVYAKAHNSAGSVNRANWNEKSNVTLMEIRA